ncbi:hypothetical protein HFD88_000964 [Aspergillus terreus]|nr:hypothetical protein HFD88_000964 [Aspergillus terreus]
MAAILAERLLGEVVEERLDEVLHDLEELTEGISDARFEKPTGLTEIDALLGVFAPVQHPAPVQAQPDDHVREPREEEDQPHVQSESDQRVNAPHSTEYTPSLCRGKAPVIEISSTASAAGKSQLLYYLTAIAILPSRCGPHQLGGRESAVAFIDTDGRFDVERLRTIAQGIIRKRLPDQDATTHADDIRSIIITSLQHLHIFRPQSSASLLSTLQHLDTYLFDLTRHFSATRPLHAVFIDSASAFFWQDKLHDEVARVEDIGRAYADIEHDRRHKQSFYLSEMYADLVAELKRLQHRFSCALIYTTTAWSGRPATTGPGDSNPGPFTLYEPHLSTLKFPSARPSLPAPWGTFPTVRLLVRREAVRPFPSDMTPAEAQADAAMRQGVVLRGRFSAWVNGWGCEDWPRRIVDRLDSMNWGMFAFHVRNDGVHID